MTNRQIKWVIKRQKIYDFLSLQWSLPLWDRDYMSFWERIPLEQKRKQKLYINTLIERNWEEFGMIFPEMKPVMSVQIGCDTLCDPS